MKEMLRKARSMGSYLVADVYPDERNIGNQFSPLFSDEIKYMFEESMIENVGFHGLIIHLRNGLKCHSIRQTRSRLAVDMNSTHYLHPELAEHCSLEHPDCGDHVNIGLNKMPQPLGWGKKYGQDWFLWTSPTKDGLNAKDIDDFSKDIPSVVLQNELKRDTETYVDES